MFKENNPIFWKDEQNRKSYSKINIKKLKIQL